MALENITEVEQSLGIESGKLAEMMNSEEKVTLDLSNRVMMEKTVFEERIANTKKETISHTEEVFIKNLRNEFELDFTGKTKENLNEAFKAKFQKAKEDSVKDPEKRYTELKTDFDTLQVNFLAKDREIENIRTEASAKEKRNKITSDIFRYMPENTLVSKNTILIEAEQKGFKFEDEDGRTVVKNNNGEIIKKTDGSLSPLDVKDWITDFIVPFLPKNDGGSGRGDETPPSKAGSWEAFEKEAEKNGWDNTKINEEVVKRTKDGTLKM